MDPLPRQKRETLASRAKENSPLVVAASSIAVAVVTSLVARCESRDAREQAASASAQATVTQDGQARADVELDAAYQAIAAKLEATGASVEELARLSREQAARIELLESVVKSGLGNTAAGRKFQPAEPAEPDLPLEEVTEPLPASPAAAARRKP